MTLNISSFPILERKKRFAVVRWCLLPWSVLWDPHPIQFWPRTLPCVSTDSKNQSDLIVLQSLILFILLSSKKENEAYEITIMSVCPSLCLPPPQITSEQMTRFLWNSVGKSCIESDLYTILFNNIASTIPKWWMFRLNEVDAKLASVSVEK
jgi:hypothetical protein